MAPTASQPESPKPAGKRALDYTNRAAPKSLIGERIADMLKTLVWVIPLTVLIWFYAEREQSTTADNVTIPIAVRINTPDKIVTLNNPVDGKIVATLAGPRTAIADFIDSINSAKNPLVITRTLDASTPRGPLQLPASAIGDDPSFVQKGITLRNISPQSLQMKVDDLVTQDLPVRAVGNFDNLEGGMRFSPATVHVTAPRSVFDDALQREKEQATNGKPFDGQLYVEADTSKLSSLLNVPGSHENLSGVQVSLAQLNKPYIKIEPLSVSANFVVAEKNDEFTVKPVPIWLTGPEGFFGKYDVEIQGSKSLPEVTLEGPKEKIAEFKDRYLSHKLDPPFVALIDLDAKDRGDVPNKPATFRLPDGLHIKPVPGQKLAADVRVTPR